MALKSWSVASVSANTETDFVTQAGAGLTTIVIGITVANYSASNATINLKKTNSSNTLSSYILAPTIVNAGNTLFIDTKQVITLQGKIRATSDQANVSFEACGDES